MILRIDAWGGLVLAVVCSLVPFAALVLWFVAMAITMDADER